MQARKVHSRHCAASGSHLLRSKATARRSALSTKATASGGSPEREAAGITTSDSCLPSS